MQIQLRPRIAALLLAAAALFVTAPARSQEPSGERKLSSNGAEPAVDAGRNGFMVVWAGADAQHPGIFGLRLLPDGAVRSAPFRVDAAPPGEAPEPARRGGFRRRSLPGGLAGRRGGLRRRPGGRRLPRPRAALRRWRLQAGSRLPPLQRRAGAAAHPAGDGRGRRRLPHLLDGGSGRRQDHPCLPLFGHRREPGPELRLPVGGRSEESYGVGVARYPDGFAVGWQEVFDCHQGLPGGNQGAIARFDPDGRRAGRVLRVGDFACSSADSASLIALVGSRTGALAVFVSGEGYFAQRFGPSGEAAGGHVHLRKPPVCGEARCDTLAAVALDDSGRIAVIWEVIEKPGSTFSPSSSTRRESPGPASSRSTAAPPPTSRTPTRRWRTTARWPWPGNGWPPRRMTTACSCGCCTCLEGCARDIDASE